jgi:inhibitor of KinA
MENVRFLIGGDSCLTVQFGNEINLEINKRVSGFAERLKSKNISGLVEIIPTYCTVFIGYNPGIISFEKLVKKLKPLCAGLHEEKVEQKKIWEIPVCYCEEYGQDLSDVAELLNMTPEEVIKRHSNTDYRIYMLGFLPGFAYLGGMDKALSVPRLDSPRAKIPAGSVGIGGEQTGVYPLDSPGGWRLIGTTPLLLYDVKREEPILYKAGDYLRFVPITGQTFKEIQTQVLNGSYKYKVCSE